MPRRVVIGTNASQGVLKRLSAWVLPVYDHVLMTEPLTTAQLDAIGWKGREGLTDAGNQFHYYRRTLDDRVLFGGYDANYHFPGRIDPAFEQSDASHGLLADHFLDLFPQLEGDPVHPPLGRGHRHDVALHAGLRHGLRRPDGVCRRLHRAGRRLDPLRCRGRARPRRRQGHRAAPGWAWCGASRSPSHRSRFGMPPCGATRSSLAAEDRTGRAQPVAARPRPESASASTP